MLNFDQVGSRNLDKLPTNLVNWVLAMLLNLINFGSFCWDNWLISILIIPFILGDFNPFSFILMFPFGPFHSFSFNL